MSVNSGNTIVVYAGSYTTNVAISADTQMSSKSVTLTASNNTRTRKNPENNIQFKSDVENFVFYSENTSIHFRVGADINLAKGIYYINWSISEEGHSANNDVQQYHQPMKTKVEVVAKKANKWSFQVEGFTGGNTYKGTSSPDIGVSVSNSPFSDVTVGLSLLGGENTEVTFEPSSLVFGPEDTVKYFRITIGSDYDLSTANP